jgi:hypothetical protein
VWVVVVLVIVGGALLWAALYDRKERRRGSVLRRSGDISNEATQSRLDIDAVPYEPARHAGQRDWATYRARDRKTGGRDDR